MTAGVMVTNGGVHSPDDWAVMTCSQLIQINPQTSGSVAAGRRLENAVIAYLEEKYTQLQASEREALAVDDSRILSPPDCSFIDTWVAELVAMTSGTEFEAHFSQDHVQLYSRNTIGQHAATIIDVEWLWYAENNDSPNIRKFKELRNL